MAYQFNPFTGKLDIVGAGGSGAVNSVNGQTGTVVLDAADVGAAAATVTYTIPANSTGMGATCGFIASFEDTPGADGWYTTDAEPASSSPVKLYYNGQWNEPYEWQTYDVITQAPFAVGEDGDLDADEIYIEGGRQYLTLSAAGLPKRVALYALSEDGQYLSNGLFASYVKFITSAYLWWPGDATRRFVFNDSKGLLCEIAPDGGTGVILNQLGAVLAPVNGEVSGNRTADEDGKQSGYMLSAAEYARVGYCDAWYTGSDAPTASTPAEAVVGDFYLRSNGDVYQKVQADDPGAWSLICNVAGTYAPQGVITSSGLTASASGVVIGRKTASAGALEELTIDTDLSSVSASDDTIPSAKATKAALDLKAASGAITSSGLTMATDRILGRTTASTGAIEELTFDTVAGIDWKAGAVAINTANQTAIFGRHHVLSDLGTAADYTFYLPTVASGDVGKLVSIEIDSAATKLITIDPETGAGTTNKIDGATTRVLWAKETCILRATSTTTWTKIAGKSIPMIGKLSKTDTQTFAANTPTKITFDTTTIDNLVVDNTNDKLIVRRPGTYSVVFNAKYRNTNTSNCYVQSRINKGNGGGASTLLELQAQPYVASTLCCVYFRLITTAIVDDYFEAYAYYNTGTFTGASPADSPLANTPTFELEEIPTW